MRWVRYEADGAATYGMLEGDEVVEVRGDPFQGYEATKKRRPLASVKLLVPVMPRTFYAAGLNYLEHVTAVANRRGETPKIPKAADIGYRGNNGLIAHGETIVIPADASDRVQYEAELVAVIGRTAKHLSEA
jgi:2-keto-4-pentenoate hydratase/2-oxohepta-3-ene-1,7-dioic acid hydratase in catechol pathway